MEFVAKQRKVKITIGSESFEVRCPTLGDVEAMQEKMAATEEKNSLSVYKSFFEKIGLPEHAYKQLDVADFQDFVEFLMSPKKK